MKPHRVTVELEIEIDALTEKDAERVMEDLLIEALDEGQFNQAYDIILVASEEIRSDDEAPVGEDTQEDEDA